ncbi:hypothetical protein JCM14076_23710 [Methylosoma difficile]
MNFVNKLFSYSMNENKFFNEFKQEFYTEKIDENHSYHFDSKHPNIIKIGCNDVGCMALQGFNNTDSPAIRITYLFIYEQNIGTGSLILSKLCELADKYNVILELDAIPQKKTKNSISREKLVSWYQSYGFNLEIEGEYLMRRYVQF